jgi:hypothetical protein
MEIESMLFFLQFSIMEKAPDKLPEWHIFIIMSKVHGWRNFA